METGIVGLPQVGKSILFDALTGGQSTTQGSGGSAARVGIADVPDPRLDLIAQYITTRKIVPATIRLVDIPGFAAGGDSGAFGRTVLSHVREVDAICHVVKCFGGDASPPRDISDMDTELILADLAIVEPALEKAQKSRRSGDREAEARKAVLQRILPVLEEGENVRSVTDLDAEQQRIVRGLGLITAKPVLYVANVDEGDLAGESQAVEQVRQHAEATGAEMVAVCASLEAELAAFRGEERDEMLESLGLEEPALAIVARALHRSLGLASFYTAGEKEVRAWTIPRGATAPEAAGAVHSDIQRGFIRAECYFIDDLARHKSEKAIREAGRLRSEGKSYRMADGDVVHFLFNV